MSGSPLSEPVFLILLMLAEGPRHGYAILQDVERWTEGRVVLRTATLYTALRRLVDDGRVAEIPDPDGDPRRRTYRITAAGRALVREETARLREVVGLADRLATGGRGG